MNAPRILYLDILTDDVAKKKQFDQCLYDKKSYERHLARELGVPLSSFTIVRGYKDTFPDPKKFDALIVGPSTENPVRGEEKPWMKRTYTFIRHAVKAKLPILGICGGLQFTVRAFGVPVVYNPRGRNFGSIVSRLTRAGKRDPLFKGLRPSFRVQASHKCIAKRLPAGATVLACSAKSPYEVLAIGDRIRLLQNHPEFTAPIMRRLARMRKDLLIEEGYVRRDDFEKLLSAFKNTSKTGRTILRNFLKYFVEPKKSVIPSRGGQADLTPFKPSPNL